MRGRRSANGNVWYARCEVRKGGKTKVKIWRGGNACGGGGTRMIGVRH